jgi:hypothetical protein
VARRGANGTIPTPKEKGEKMHFILTYQQANQIAAALRIFQAIQRHDASLREVLDDDQIEALIYAVYKGASPDVSVGYWHNQPDFDDEGEVNGHTLILNHELNPVFATCGGTTAADLALATAAPDLLEALQIWARYAKSNNWQDNDHYDTNGTGWITLTERAIARATGAPD